MAYNPQNPNGQATKANSTPVVLASDQNNALETGGNLATIAGAVSSSKVNVNISSGAVAGPTASGSSLTANPITVGGLAKTALPTAVSDGQVVNEMVDKFGRLVVLPNGMRDLILPMTQLTLTSTTTETTLISGVASTFNDIISLVVINTSATATQVDFRDSTAGTVRFSLYIPAGDTRGISLSTPMPQNTAGNNWTAKCGTSVASVIVTGSYVSNK